MFAISIPLLRNGRFVNRDAATAKRESRNWPCKKFETLARDSSLLIYEDTFKSSRTLFQKMLID
jgi:hypothetical protein